ncbi:hypothetical protein SNEBB_002777 [Seison nebaliae]|nr:hypothetical protein SNEBB_002777 [Seison nebaliae]
MTKNKNSYCLYFALLIAYLCFILGVICLVVSFIFPHWLRYATVDKKTNYVEGVLEICEIENVNRTNNDIFGYDEKLDSIMPGQDNCYQWIRSDQKQFPNTKITYTQVLKTIQALMIISIILCFFVFLILCYTIIVHKQISRLYLCISVITAVVAILLIIVILLEAFSLSKDRETSLREQSKDIIKDFSWAFYTAISAAILFGITGLAYLVCSILIPHSQSVTTKNNVKKYYTDFYEYRKNDSNRTPNITQDKQTNQEMKMERSNEMEKTDSRLKTYKQSRNKILKKTPSPDYESDSYHGDQYPNETDSTSNEDQPYVHHNISALHSPIYALTPATNAIYAVTPPSLASPFSEATFMEYDNRPNMSFESIDRKYEDAYTNTLPLDMNETYYNHRTNKYYKRNFPNNRYHHHHHTKNHHTKKYNHYDRYDKENKHRTQQRSSSHQHRSLTRSNYDKRTKSQEPINLLMSPSYILDGEIVQPYMFYKAEQLQPTD